jgi:hypothetical protein
MPEEVDAIMYSKVTFLVVYCVFWFCVSSTVRNGIKMFLWCTSLFKLINKTV